MPFTVRHYQVCDHLAVAEAFDNGKPVRETLAAASPLADSVYALQCLGSMPVTLGGSDELRRRIREDDVKLRLGIP